MAPTSAWSDRYREYWLASGRHHASEQLRSTSFFVLVCQAAFVVLDAWAYPEHFWLFFPARMSVNALVLYVLFRGRQQHPNASQMTVALAVGAEILLMIYATGGPNSLYYTGLLLVFVGAPVLQPMTVKQSLVLSSMCCIAFASSPMLTEPPQEVRSFAIALIFVISGGFESAVSSHVLTRARVRAFEQRREIEASRDKLAELDREKSRFSANVHHELRTPLTLLLAPLEGMLAGQFGDVSDLQQTYMRSMQSNALRLLKLINNLLDFAKIESNQASLARRPTRVGALAEQIVSGARPMAEQKGVRLESVGLDSLPDINVDADAIEKVLVNLVGNALKFTAEGWIEVAGRVGAFGGVAITVSDTGAGIPKDDLERVFDRFAQVDGSSTRRYEGTGIGLALVRELIALHGGRVWAESDGLGMGARFHVELPAGAPDDGGVNEVAAALASDSRRLRNEIGSLETDVSIEDRHREELRYGEMRRVATRDTSANSPTPKLGNGTQLGPDVPEVLICEDNPDMRRLLAHLISDEFRVRVAANGREGLEMAQASIPDLILTDVMMPEISGTELCASVKADPVLAQVPVVLVTSKADREMKIEGLELGADEYITKPFHPRELMARVRSIVRLRRTQMELDQQNSLLESTNAELRAALSELHEAGVQLVKAERLAAVGELAAGVAHEINNPMNFAINALRTMSEYVSDLVTVTTALADVQEGGLRERGSRAGELAKRRDRIDIEEMASTLRELLAIVTEGLDRTQRLVGDLRDFASPGEGVIAQVDIARGLRTTVQLVGHAAQERGVALIFENPGTLPVIEGDPRALNQVFLNLIKNATESIEGPEGVVAISAVAVGGQITVQIQDNGAGIAPDRLARVFEPFFTTKEAGRGSGLGLSISRRIVDEHSGTIDVWSEEGVGTTFRVTLPYQDNASAA